MVAHDKLRERFAEIVYDEYRVGRMPDYQPMWHTLEDKPAAMLRAADRILALFGEPVMEWQPIETAPRGGTGVLIAGGTYIYDADGYSGIYSFDRIVVAQWSDLEKQWKRDGFGAEYDGEYWHQPTHWMPLPAPPATSGEETTDDPR